MQHALAGALAYNPHQHLSSLCPKSTARYTQYPVPPVPPSSAEIPQAVDRCESPSWRQDSMPQARRWSLRSRSTRGTKNESRAGLQWVIEPGFTQLYDNTGGQKGGLVSSTILFFACRRSFVSRGHGGTAALSLRAWPPAAGQHAAAEGRAQNRLPSYHLARVPWHQYEYSVPRTRSKQARSRTSIARAPGTLDLADWSSPGPCLPLLPSQLVSPCHPLIVDRGLVSLVRHASMPTRPTYVRCSR